MVGNHPLEVRVLSDWVWRRKYKLGPTKQISVPEISSLARGYVSSSSPQSERILPPGGGFVRSTCTCGTFGMHTHIHSHSLAHSSPVYPSIHPSIHTKTIHTKIYTCIHTCIHTHMHTYIHKHTPSIHPSIHTHIYTCIHTCIHTHAYIHT